MFLKTVLSISFLVLISVIFLPAAMGYAAPTGMSSHLQATNPLTVWFNGAFQLTLAYPPAYEFNVAAKTASGLWITSLHWDFGDGATRDVPFSAQSQVSDIEDHQYSSPGNFCVTVTAYDSAGNVASVSQPLLTNYDFTLTATPATQNVTPGASASYNVVVGQWPMACGGGVSVGLTVPSPAPQGVTWTLNPSSGNTPFTSTLQVQTSATTPTGAYTINIVGTSPKLAHTATVTLIVGQPYFVLSATPGSLFVPPQPNAQPGVMNTTTVTVQSFNGFNSPVTLTDSGLPNGMTASFLSPIITPPANGQVATVLTFTTPCSVSPGSYPIVVQGTDGRVTRQATVTLTVASCPAAQGFGIFGIWPWIILSVIGLLILLPILLILLYKPRPVLGPAVIPAAVPVIPATVPVTPIPPPPPEMPCPVCGNPLRPVELRWYCDFCQRYVWIHPQ